MKPETDSGEATSEDWEEEEWAALEKRSAAESIAPDPVDGDNRTEDSENENGSLPSLEEAIEKIPASTRQQLDELFRGKFIAVKRLRKKDLY